MDHSYIVLLWDAENGLNAATALQLQTLLRQQEGSFVRQPIGPGGVALLPDRPGGITQCYGLPDGAGLVFGSLFRAGSSTRLLADDLLSDSRLRCDSTSATREHLIRNYWGAYVAILPGPSGTSWEVLRDCSGMIPCYYTSISGVTVVFSDVRQILCLEPVLALNWKYITAFLSWPHLQIRETGLRGVFELLAGEGITIRRSRRETHFAWSPESVCASEPLLDENDARQALLDAGTLSVTAWAGAFSRIVHSLSGGFDSSVVLGLLMSSPQRPDVICVNRFGNGPGEDERHHAQTAARAYGAPLIEFPWDSAAMSFDASCLSAPPPLKPAITFLVALLEAPLWDEICAAQRAESIWTGQGGDHLFMTARTDLGVADCQRLCGLGSDLRMAIRDSAALTGHSIWHVMVHATAALINPQHTASAARVAPDPRFVCAEAVPSDLQAYVQHPWSIPSPPLLPGKHFQLMQLADVLNRHRSMPGIRNTEEFHPLLSQPLLEVVLRIPLHILLRNGRTRGLARRAFSDLVPPQILARELKGNTATYYADLFRRSLPFTKELLLDGILVREGVLSRSALIDALESDEPLAGANYFPMFACLACEVWARSWVDIQSSSRS